MRSPSIYFWQSFSASVGWLIHVCSCGEQCLQQSWKLKSCPFRSCKCPNIFMCNILGINLRAVFPFIWIIYSHSAKTSLIDELKSLQEPTQYITFSHIHHNISVWNLVNESHFSTLWYLLPVRQTTHRYQNDPLPRTQKGPLLANKPIYIGLQSRRQQPRPARPVSSGSGLGGHPNCSLKLPCS